MAGIIKVNQYQDFNGNTLFTSDGSGNLTTQEIMYPAFEAHLSSSQSLTDNTAAKVQFDNEILIIVMITQLITDLLLQLVVNILYIQM